MLSQARRSLAVSICSLIALFATPHSSHAAGRGSECYTAWDDYYFYAAVQVNDPHVNAVNTTPMSQPQEDDDIEVFFDTKGANAGTARIPGTYQMAVSAASGAYFSVGDADGKPKAKIVFTYKYAANVEGTLNHNNDNDTGYTVELAIPWRELGQDRPPVAGTVWGFNIINRDRETPTQPATHLASLSSGVTGASSVQNPTDWTKITFTDSVASLHSGPDMVYCPHVVGHFPIIDGVVRSGEYNRPDGFALPAPTISAAAPTHAQEPNIDVTDDQMFQKAIAETPNPTTATQPPAESGNGGNNSEAPQLPVPIPAAPTQPTQSAKVPDYDIELPGGGAIHVGKLPPPPQPEPTAAPVYQPTPKSRGKKGTQIASGSAPYNGDFPAVGPSIDSSATLGLPEHTRVSPLFLALYHPYFSVDPVFLDQPSGGMGSWFGGGSVQYQMDQLKDARRSGVDVLLVSYNPSDTGANGALATLVQALQDIRDGGEDYPLLALSYSGPAGDSYAAIKSFFERVPPEFRGEVYLPDAQDDKPLYIAVLKDAVDAASLQDHFAKDFEGEGAGLFVGQTGDKGIVPAAGDFALVTTTVSPVADRSKPVSLRAEGQSYDASWTAADSADADWVVLDSWNDYERGTETTATRQYGEHYADLTKLYSLQWNGNQEWRARYLKCNVPASMLPNTLYTVQVRIENAGTLPWRLGEDYGLSYRWYKDGRLYDDSAPKLPISVDIYPGQSATVSVGILPHNQYGSAIEPGDYVLVFDMIQGNNRWFSLTGDPGLKVHVKVLAAGDSAGDKATFINSTLPTRLQPGTNYTAVITVRNDSATTWKAGTTKIACDARPVDAPDSVPSEEVEHALATDIPPGAVGRVSIPIKLSSPDQKYLAKWYLSHAPTSGHLTQMVSTVSPDDGASFILSDVPRTLRAGETNTGRIGFANAGPHMWLSGHWQLGYHWTYLDGVPVKGGEEILTPIKGDVAPNVATAVTAKFQAPHYPGRYFLVWDVKDPDGRWSSEVGQKMHPAASLPLLISVTDSRDALTSQVDLTRYFNSSVIGFEGDASGNLDGSGSAIPGEMMPPDGTTDSSSNPLLSGKEEPTGYPSGYYANSSGSAHNIAFRYPDSKQGKTAISCHGQHIDLPDGYSVIHLLAASSGAQPITGTFGLEGATSKSLTIAPWSEVPASDGTVALNLTYRLKSGAIDNSASCILGDYRIAVPNGTHSMTLPDDPKIKILAITVEKQP